MVLRSVAKIVDDAGQHIGIANGEKAAGTAAQPLANPLPAGCC